MTLRPGSPFETLPMKESSDWDFGIDFEERSVKESSDGDSVRSMDGLEQNAAVLKHLHQAGYFLDVNKSSTRLMSHHDATTALHWAAQSGYIYELRYLLDRGVYVFAMEEGQRSQRRTALHRAASGGWTKVVDLLIERGAHLEARDANSWSPLHCAAYGGHCGVCEMLLKAGASVRSLNSFLETPLHCAARNGYVKVIKLLLDFGADKLAKDLRGFTPFGRAKLAKYTFEVLRVPELKNGQSDFVGASLDGWSRW